MMADPTYAEMLAIYNTLKDKFRDNANHPSMKMFTCYMYFSGHGVQCQTSYVVLNQFGNKERYFPFENKFSALANLFKNNTLLIAFDCCRENVTLDKIKEA